MAWNVSRRRLRAAPGVREQADQNHRRNPHRQAADADTTAPSRHFFRAPRRPRPCPPRITMLQAKPVFSVTACQPGCSGAEPPASMMRDDTVVGCW